MELPSTDRRHPYSLCPPSTRGEAVRREFPALLRRALRLRWVHDHTGEALSITHPQNRTPFRPPRKSLAPSDVLDLITAAFADHGIHRDTCLPLWWRSETELTSAAVQALDPWLKHHRDVVRRREFLAQPVVRLTAARGPSGRLRDGFVTAFVNTALVQPVTGLHQVPDVLDTWITILGRLGLHARHLSFHVDLNPWRRGQVEGMTIRCKHLDIGIGDLVVLWSTDDTARLAIDLGSGLERITWACSRQPWPALVHGDLAAFASADTLDTLRTVTLLLGHHISPAPRGPGSITRRLLHALPFEATQLGVGAAIRRYHTYWDHVMPLPTPWHDIDLQIEQEIAGRLRRRPSTYRVVTDAICT